MKKAVFIALFLVTAIKIFVSPDVHAQTLAPHIDPSKARDELNQLALFTYIGVGLEILEDLDDTQNVHSNADFPEEVVEHLD